MITQKVEEVIARYKSSSNTDKKNDYVRVMEYINTNVDLNDAERRKIEENVIRHFLNFFSKGKELLKQLDGKEEDKCIDAEALVNLYCTSTVEHRDEVYGELMNIYSNSNFLTKAYIQNLLDWKIRRSTKAEELAKKITMTTTQKLVELPYIQDAIDKLNQCKSVDELIEVYGNISPNITRMLLREDLLDKKKNEHKTAFDEVVSTYYKKLEELEQYTNVHPIAKINNNEVLQFCYNRIKNMVVGEDVNEVLNELFDGIQYRVYTFRTHPSSSERKFIIQKFLSGTMLLSYGRTDVQGMIQYWTDQQPIDEEKLLKELPISVVNMLMRL